MSDAVRKGHLLVVGVGLGGVGRTTIEAAEAIRHADIVHYLVGDPFAERWLIQEASQVSSLHDLYQVGRPRAISYQLMVERILDSARSGQRTCVALYGHPGVFAFPGHEAVRRATAEGIPAAMLPGVSAEDCLFADLGIDPAVHGLLSYEATDFLINKRNLDVRSHLILWQVGVIGHTDFQLDNWRADGWLALSARLLTDYPAEHEVWLYEAAYHPLAIGRKDRVSLRRLAEAEVTPQSTMVIPPAQITRSDRRIMTQIGFPFEESSVAIGQDRTG